MLVVGEREEVQPKSMECGDSSMVGGDNSMARISDDLVTFSQLPPSRWKNLLNLDVIRVIWNQLFFVQIMYVYIYAMWLLRYLWCLLLGCELTQLSLSSVYHDIYGFWCSVTKFSRLWHFHIIYVLWYNIYGFWCSTAT